MDIHEYQAKKILSGFGIEIPRGGIAYSPENAENKAREIGGSKWVVKAQIHSGARGKAGGIIICNSALEVAQAADKLLGKKLVTKQTGPQGKIVHRVYIEEASDIKKELYLGLVFDRSSECIMVVASTEGGMSVEEISKEKPESIIRSKIEVAVGIQRFQAREIAFGLGIESKLISRTADAIIGCYRAFSELDATMVEINPLVISKDEHILALDCKMSFDNNALFRRSQVSELRDKAQENPNEVYASDRGLNYVSLEGNIGNIINGAGLAMASMDMIKLAGGEPANFLDVGGGATPEKMVKAFKLISQDEKVKVILVNIFAGINRCDWVAEGIIQALEKIEIKMPLIIRLAGTNVEKGNKILAQMIETFLDEFNYINAIKDKGGLNRNLQIAGSVLSNISRLIQSFQLANVSYEYSEIGGKYIREKGGTEEDISREDYLINTFMDEFVAAQSQNN